MEELEVIELYELAYSDLLVLSNNSDNNNLNLSSTELRRLDKIQAEIIETLGPTGPGLLSITAVPDTSHLRRCLLPLARKLALLDHQQRKQILKDHCLGSDVSLKDPDRNVSSFAMQLKYEQVVESSFGKLRSNQNSYLCPDAGSVKEIQDNEFRSLSRNFKGLGYCMMEVGLLLGRVCDKAIGGHELEQSLLESGTAKGRLIHYHSSVDGSIIREAGRGKKSSKYQVCSRKEQEQLLTEETEQFDQLNSIQNGNGFDICRRSANLWQQWHYDYGIFTVLTTPSFIDQRSCQDCPYPNGNSYLQIFHPTKNKVFMVKTSPESLIVQVGEAADVLSNGQLRSTLHCVSRPARLKTISRETFVVFLQPAWSKTFSVSDDRTRLQTLQGHLSDDGGSLAQEIDKIVPPLSSRLRDGMTFAEFARETTRQYYGGGGLQSNN